jgi:hypothetical protein
MHTDEIANMYMQKKYESLTFFTLEVHSIIIMLTNAESLSNFINIFM